MKVVIEEWTIEMFDDNSDTKKKKKIGTTCGTHTNKYMANRACGHGGGEELKGFGS